MEWLGVARASGRSQWKEFAHACRVVAFEQFEVHHTPKHGSWFDVAEIFLSILAKQ